MCLALYQPFHTCYLLKFLKTTYQLSSIIIPILGLKRLRLRYFPKVRLAGRGRDEVQGSELSDSGA